MKNAHLRVITGILAGLILSLSAGACAFRPQPVTFDNTTYEFTERQGEARLYTSSDGSTLKVEPVDAEGRATHVIVDGQIYLVSGTPTEVDVTFPDGRTLTGSYMADSMAFLAPPGDSVTAEEWSKVDDLRTIVFSEAVNPQQSRNPSMVLAALVLAAVGLLEAINPHLAWQISEGWRYKNVEPSEAYLVISRIAGVVMIVIALLLIFSS